MSLKGGFLNFSYYHYDGIESVRLWRRHDDNSWHHVVATYDKRQLNIYVDGKLEASKNSSLDVFYGWEESNGAAIGRDGNYNGEHFKGLIDEFVFYNKALTQDEVTRRYNIARNWIKNALAGDNSKQGIGIQQGDQVVIRFNTGTSGIPIDKTNINKVLALDSGSWLDDSGNIGSVVWSSAYFPNDLLTIILSDQNGVPSVKGGNKIILNGDIKDNDGNPIADSIIIAGHFDSYDVCLSGCRYSGIQQAIDAAMEYDTILVNDGVYKEPIDFKGKSLSLRSLNGADVTIIDGEQKGNGVNIANVHGINVVLDGFGIINGTGVLCKESTVTISNCVIKDNGGYQAYGVYCLNSALTLIDSVINGNGSNNSLPAVHCLGSSRVLIKNCDISNNQNDAVVVDAHFLQVVNSTINDNNGNGISGMPGFAVKGCTINGNKRTGVSGAENISDSLISNNLDTGIIVTGGRPLFTPNIDNCIIIGNKNGGIILDANATVKNCNISYNSSFLGGGIRIHATETAIINSIIRGNRAVSDTGDREEAGGGIAVYYENAAVTLINCLIIENESGKTGGGVHAEGFESLISAYNCTIANNEAGTCGGGFYFERINLPNYGEMPYIENNIIWGNRANGDDNQFCIKDDTSISVKYSDVQGGWPGTGNFSADPLFVNAADGDYHLSKGSPCIDTALGEHVSGDDLDGDKRPQGAGFDLGADEYSEHQQICYRDMDNDGYSDGTTSIFCNPALGYFRKEDLIAVSGDCNDTDLNIHPGVLEICDWIDNNCDGNLDEGLPAYTLYRDADGDGYGNPDEPRQGCIPNSEYIIDNTDCNDNDLSVYPGSAEICDQIDNNCNLLKDENCREYTYFVPKDYSTIQTAIQAAINGDVIIVGKGRYLENINFLGKSITVRSQNGPAVTVINGTNASVVTFENNEQADSILDGFTITSGSGTYREDNEKNGSGINCSKSSPSILNCIIEDNWLGAGIACFEASPSITKCIINENHGEGGIFCRNSSPLITDTVISNNFSNEGGGIYCKNNSSPTFINCVISGNTAFYGGGLFVGEESIANIVNCTISGNTAVISGGGIVCSSSCCYAEARVVNSILWGNVRAVINVGTVSDEIYLAFSGNSADITYSDIQGGWPGTGNIDADPMFTDQTAGDYRLLSNSPCINTGAGDKFAYPQLPDHDFDGEKRPFKSAYDMGADEYVFCGNTDMDGDGIFDMCDNCINVKNPDQCDTNSDGYGNACDGDLNNDGRANSVDLGLFKKSLLLPKTDPVYRDADFNCDGKVNAIDLGLFKKLLQNKLPGPSGLK
ncbi:MAG: right-handed parallel beta-helix repeat-containing protein [Candidatus Schekmanbacteria bacterium]|nr:right-handed parallel beta-helix repeat-containing protein [Candidatus Schekmanbacteria bacterium]